jgi:hypothetical protein
MGPTHPRNSTRPRKTHPPKKPRRKPAAQSPERAKRKERALREGIKRFLAADRPSQDAVHERPSPTKLRDDRERRAEAILEAAQDAEPARATDSQLQISPTQVLREIRDGVPVTELREIHDRLDVALSVVSLCAAVLQVQMADYDADVAAALKHCVGDILDTQMERITTLIEGGAHEPQKKR